MVTEVKKATSILEVQQMLENIKPKKNLDTSKYLGKINWGEDALAYQKKIRNEWE